MALFMAKNDNPFPVGSNFISKTLPVIVKPITCHKKHVFENIITNCANKNELTSKYATLYTS